MAGAVGTPQAGAAVCGAGIFPDQDEPPTWLRERLPDIASDYLLPGDALQLGAGGHRLVRAPHWDGLELATGPGGKTVLPEARVARRSRGHLGRAHRSGSGAGGPRWWRRPRRLPPHPRRTLVGRCRQRPDRWEGRDGRGRQPVLRWSRPQLRVRPGDRRVSQRTMRPSHGAERRSFGLGALRGVLAGTHGGFGGKTGWSGGGAAGPLCRGDVPRLAAARRSPGAADRSRRAGNPRSAACSARSATPWAATGTRGQRRCAAAPAP